MKSKLLYSGMAAASLLTAAFNATSHADSVVASDEDLDQIAGKAGNRFYTNFQFKVYLAFTGIKADDNVQWGIEQWSDNHATDVSVGKAANHYDGTSSTFQAVVTEMNNAIFWGGLGQNALDVGSMSGGTQLAYGVFADGGF